MPTLHFLGTAGYHQNDTRQTVCAYIPEFNIVLDAGSGIYRLRERLASGPLNIFLSHLHLDHSVGVTYLLDVLWGTDTRACVWALPEHLEAMRAKLFASELFPLAFGGEQFPHKTALAPLGKWTGIARSDREETYTVTAKELKHPGKSVGFRFIFPDGKVLAYITDTTCSLEYLDLVRNADVLVHECNFPDTFPGKDAWWGRDRAEETGHSWTSGVADLANIAGVKKLVLTHFNPLDPRDDPSDQENAHVRHPNTVIAHDGMVLEF